MIAPYSGNSGELNMLEAWAKLMADHMEAVVKEAPSYVFHSYDLLHSDRGWDIKFNGVLVLHGKLFRSRRLAHVYAKRLIGVPCTPIAVGPTDGNEVEIKFTGMFQ